MLNFDEQPNDDDLEVGDILLNSDQKTAFWGFFTRLSINRGLNVSFLKHMQHNSNY